MSFAGLELNASWARAVQGPADEWPRPLPLEPPHLELPLVVLRDDHQPLPGERGSRLCREQPYRVWQHFLPLLGLSSRQAALLPRYYHPEETLQATLALLQHLKQRCGKNKGVVLAVPAYLEPEQLKLLRGLAKQCGLHLLGSLPTALAAGMASYMAHPWMGSAVVVDVDDHALTLARVEIAAGQVQLGQATVLVSLGLKNWKDRLLKALADCCIRQSRRDPRASPQAEQDLYENLDAVLDASRQGRTVQLGLQAAQWYQNILVRPEQPPAFCQHLVRKAVAAVHEAWQTHNGDGQPSRLLLSAAAARLPGLLPALNQAFPAWLACSPRPQRRPSDDFGEDLLPEEVHAPGLAEVLPPEAMACASHSLAAAWSSGALRRHHLTQAPLPMLHLSV